MTRKRYISLYFSSIGMKQISIILWGLLATAFSTGNSRRAELHKIINDRLSCGESFSYSSGRGALTACLKAAKLGLDDEVLLSSFTCLAVPTAVLAAGAKPIYCDIDPRTLNVTVETVMAAITPKTKVVVVQHTLGSIAPVEQIKQQIHGLGILVIEDCALALGSENKGVFVGSKGDAAIFSMELSKTLSVGWGGVLTVNNKALASCVRAQYDAIKAIPFLKSLLMSFQTAMCALFYSPNWYWFAKYAIAVGFKTKIFMKSTPDAENEGRVSETFCSKLAGQQAALAIHQWSRLDKIRQPCIDNGIRLRHFVRGLGYVPLGFSSKDTVSVSPRISILVSDRKLIIEWFHLRGIELGVWFDGPLSPLPTASVYHFNKHGFPNASFVANHIINIPSHSRLTQLDLQLIETTMMEYVAAHPSDLEFQKQIGLLEQKLSQRIRRNRHLCVE